MPVAKVTHCRHASGELPSQRFADHGVDLFPRKLRDPLQRHDAAVADQVDMRVDQPQEARSHRHNRLGHSRMVARIPTAQPRQCHHPRRARWRRRTRNLHHQRHGLHESRTHCRATQASGACQMRISCEEPARGIRPPPIRITFISLLLPLTDVRPDEFRNAVGLRTGLSDGQAQGVPAAGLTFDAAPARPIANVASPLFGVVVTSLHIQTCVPRSDRQHLPSMYPRLILRIRCWTHPMHRRMDSGRPDRADGMYPLRGV